MRVKSPVNIAILCAELLEWRATGLLKGHALRAFARANFNDDLQAAEQFITLEAIKIVAHPVPSHPWAQIPG